MGRVGKRKGKGVVIIGEDEFPNAAYVVQGYRRRHGDLSDLRTLYGVLKADKQLARAFQHAPKARLRLESGEEVEIAFDSEACGPGSTPFIVLGDLSEG